MALSLEQIIANALKQIGHSSDAQKTSEWNDQFMNYANEAQLDLARHARKKRTEDLVVTDGMILRTSFARELLKVSSVKSGSTSYGFTAEDPAAISITGLDAGTVSVTYEYAPEDMKDGQEFPDIPESLHAAIPLYISYRYYMTKDESQQRRAIMFFDAYERMKKNYSGNLGGSDQYSLLNVFS